MGLTRRKFVAQMAVLGVAGGSLVKTCAEGAPAIISKEPGSSLAGLDRTMMDYMSDRKTPGGALAVLKNGRLIYARGYGLADREKGEVATPRTLFRLASLSKPITALGVFKLIEEGRLSLDDRVMDLLLLDQRPLKHGTMDRRWKDITLRHLLQHSGGWDRDKSFDPMFRSRAIAGTQGTKPPAEPWAIIDYMLGQPLQFDPGRGYAYSNFGYCLLGRVIEKTSGMEYGEFMRRRILEPCGIHSMCLGHTRLAQRASHESRYYTEPARMVPNVLDEDEKNSVAEPYGGFYLEAMDAHGGWVASVMDLARLSARIGDESHCPVLRPETFAKIYERPAAPLWTDAKGQPSDVFYAGGWMVRPKGAAGRPNFWHLGSLPGTFTLWVRRGDGMSWMALFNQRSENEKFPDGAIDAALNQTVDSVREWPDVDLFERSN